MKDKLIKILVDDFIKMYPDANRATIMHLQMSLTVFDISELELLVSGCEK